MPVGFLAIGLPQHADEHRPECPSLLEVDQELAEGASRGQVAEACHEQLQPSFLSGFRRGESRAYGGEGGRMIAAISIGIIIIIAVMIAALAIVFLVLKGSPREPQATGPRLAPRGCQGTHRSRRLGRSPAA